MIKKTGAKKTSVKAPKKPLKQKATAPVSPKKSAAKKTAAGKVAAVARLKEKPVIKKKAKVQTQKKKIQKPQATVAKKESAATKAVAKKAVRKTPTAATPRKTSKKAKTSLKAERPPKKVDVRSSTKRGEEAITEGQKKITKKVAEQPLRKGATKKTEESKIDRPLKSHPKTVVAARAKKEEAEKRKEPEETIRQKAAGKKPLIKKPVSPKQEEIVQIKKAVLPKEVKKEALTATQGLQGIKAKTLPAEQQPPKITSPSHPVETLPSEYGENSITLMTVNPYRIFSFWEVRIETLKTFRGVLHLRLYNVTGIDFDVTESVSCIDLPISQRIGKMYLDVSPARDYVADIGIVFDGIFIAIARSPKVSTPAAAGRGEEEFLSEESDISIRVGY